MALSDTKSTADTRILYPYKNQQTYRGWKTYHIGLRRPNRTIIIVDTLIQPAISQSQASCLKNTTDFVNFIERVKTNNRAVLVSMDVTSLYTSILQEEGSTVCAAYDTYYDKNPPIPNTTWEKCLD